MSVRRCVCGETQRCNEEPGTGDGTPEFLKLLEFRFTGEVVSGEENFTNSSEGTVAESLSHRESSAGVSVRPPEAADVPPVVYMMAASSGKRHLWDFVVVVVCRTTRQAGS